MSSDPKNIKSDDFMNAGMNLRNPDTKTLREASDSGLNCDEQFPSKIEVSGGNISLVVDFSGSDNVKEDQDQVFLDGNLVWVRTKSNRWWPAEVVGFKADANQSFMVRYIGPSPSHVVSWCAPSRLQPFKESFETVVNLKNNKGFFVAVDKAMYLLGNSLKLEMTCSCIAQGNGILSPQSGKTRKTRPLILREFSLDRLEPKEFLTDVKNLGICAANTGILKITVMQTRLSAFHSFFGHKQVPMSQLHQTEGRKSFTTKMKDSQFVGSPSIVASTSRTRFRKNWFRKFISEVDNMSVRDNLVNVPPSDLMYKLKLLAVDYECSDETGNIGLVEWFFSRFRISVFHDENVYKMQLANMARLKDLMLARNTNPRTEQKISKSKTEPLSGVLVAASELTTFEFQKLEKSRIKTVADTEQTTFLLKKSEKLNIETFNAVSTPDNEQKASKLKKSGKTKVKDIIHSGFSSSVTNERFAIDFQETSSIPSSQGKASLANPHRRPPATLVPDLNTGGNALDSAEFDHLQRQETFILPNILPQEQETPRPMILNFQVGAPCSTHGTSGTGFVSSQSALDRKFTSADLFTNVTNSGEKKRGRKRKNVEELPVVGHATTGIPDLNGLTTEPASVLPQVEPTQRRRRPKKEELPNGLTRGITVLFLKFSSQTSMPSRDDLTSTFSAFGPLDSSETHIAEEFRGAQVAFVSSGDAIEAVKSLEKANPFGESLVSFKLQQKLITVQRNIAPRMPVISHVSPLPKLSNTLTMDSMRQNLMMMTEMLEKSGDRLSRETKAKLKTEIAGLLEKVSSMPSSSSS